MLLKPIYHSLRANICSRSTKLISKIAFVRPCSNLSHSLLSPFPMCLHSPSCIEPPHGYLRMSVKLAFQYLLLWTQCSGSGVSHHFFLLSILSLLWLLCSHVGKPKQLPWPLREKQRSTKAFYGTLRQTDWVWSSKNESDFFKMR